ncbi:myb/SANT-like DNA-binding domain-containing protein 3 [Rhagoletis pomonella]|uniref:myb/SANT-like DNA-binding domain-containing protein 3 n=1 Tax=Rhagoletis pomonella TaxID=28610 RepID=UPI001784E26F|nr:myb/SANT-like DNA-binding domain-containing protein 3 [Rhagoletis pomonella]
MDDKKRNRLPNFTSGDESPLITLVERYANKIENKRSDAVSWEEKRKAWEEIDLKFESQTGIRRGPKNLREKYENMKKRTRKNLADEKRELYKTGGGQFQHRPDKNTGRLATLMGQSATGLENYVDSDAIVTYEQEPEYLDESMQSCTVEHLDAALEAKEHRAAPMRHPRYCYYATSAVRCRRCAATRRRRNSVSALLVDGVGALLLRDIGALLLCDVDATATMRRRRYAGLRWTEVWRHSTPEWPSLVLRTVYKSKALH